MKFVSLLALLLLSISCGKNGSSSSSTADKDSCSLNGRAVACETIQGADGLGIDLLEAMIDVPVKITDSDITFQSDKSASSKGRRISCQATVKNGEIYRYALRGNTLVLMTQAGSYEMIKTSDGSGLIGTWAWKGYVDEGMHMIRQMSFLSNERVVMRTNCEL